MFTSWVSYSNLSYFKPTKLLFKAHLLPLRHKIKQKSHQSFVRQIIVSKRFPETYIRNYITSTHWNNSMTIIKYHVWGKLCQLLQDLPSPSSAWYPTHFVRIADADRSSSRWKFVACKSSSTSTGSSSQIVKSWSHVFLTQSVEEFN